VEREAEYPWVLRQMAVYQNYCPKTSSSNWIFLQPSEHITSVLSKNVRNSEGNDELSLLNYEFASSLNLAILVSTEMDWRQYINYLESEINTLVRVLTHCLFQERG
jgi:hypothetical protein